jgi:anti-anti-sigma regulatory factor
MTAITTIIPSTTIIPAASIFELPRRFDVHEVDRVATTLRALSADRSSLSIDASAVEMIDLAGLAALTTATEISSLHFLDPSVAFLATVQYTGHDLLAACCDVREFPEAA